MTVHRKQRKHGAKRGPSRTPDVMTLSGRTAARDDLGRTAGASILDAFKDREQSIPSVSHYEIVDQLGEGGMGAVFLGHHVSEGGIRKAVAIKVLKDTTDDVAIRRFVEEAQLLAQLSQGTVVELLALERLTLDTPGRRDPATGRIIPPRKRKLYFMVQEYINGPGLEEVLQKLHERVLLMHPAMVGFILNKSAIALAEAHDLTDETGLPLNLIHRDISPSNILFNAKAGITKLADFGVAKAFKQSEPDASGKPTLVGKPRYMAPEQLAGAAEEKSDVWALGVIGYECLTGFSPYRVFGSTLSKKVHSLHKQMNYPLRAPKEMLCLPCDRRFDLDELSDIIMRCLQQKPADRPSAVELNAQLEANFLYTKGLGPTNKTLAAYLRLLECAIGDGEVIPPPDYAESEDAKVLCATLWLEDPLAAFTKRSSRLYNKEFVQAVKAKQANPCLQPRAAGPFAP